MSKRPVWFRRISFEDRGSEVSGAICFPPDFKSVAGSKGNDKTRPVIPFPNSFSFKPEVLLAHAQ